MTAEALSDRDYHAHADALLAALEAQADAWLQDGTIDIDTARSGGLLELSFPNGSKLVINKQPPLQEIWVAARQGGFHFKWRDGAWRDTRDGTELLACLAVHLSAQGGQPLQLRG